jgi:thiol:disulfide interchange protein
VTDAREGRSRLSVSFSVPPDHHIYADQVSVEAPGVELTALDVPEPERVNDAFSGEERDVYERDFTLRYDVGWGTATDAVLSVGYQGCSREMCFLPARVKFRVTRSGLVEREAAGWERPSVAPAAEDWRAAAEGFTVSGRRSGYLSVREFLGFLQSREAGAPSFDDRFGRLAGRGVVMTLLLVLLWGLALNLTPCVYPMIPINLAIIGAGVEGTSRGRGFWLGLLYGGGMAVTYGILGLVVVLTGSVFGSLNASPWFNLAIAVLFGSLSLAMFGVFTIDFSRFQGKFGAGRGGTGRYLIIPLLGAVAALLAGACVAPAVIAVLAYSAALYAQGGVAGLVLPFVLGVGMALPWPLAGAGLSFMPRPGRWMEYVKYAMGILILILAAYYAHGAYEGFLWRSPARHAQLAEIQVKSAEEDGWLTSLTAGLEQARREKKPVLIDFWASWCKNCLAMEKTTFRSPEVRAGLNSFVRVKFRAEDPGASPAREVLEHFAVPGLPTYVILTPRE